MKKRITAAAIGLVTALTSAPYVMQAEAAEEEYAIRDKWGYCSTANYAESEHFVIFYGNSDTTGKVNDAFIKRNLEAYERLWHCYTEYLGMTNLNVDIYGKSSKKYKTNVYLTYTGLDQYKEGWAFMSSEDGYGIEIISPEAMLDDLTIAHEFGHVVHFQQRNWVDQEISGAWWEPMANWFREMYLGSSYNPTDTKTGNFDPYLRNLSLALPHGRNYYETWPFLAYLAYNPDNLDGLGITSVHRLLSESKPDEYPLDMITRILGTDAHIVLGNYAKRMVTFDFGMKDAYRKRFRTVMNQTPYYWNLFYTVPDKTTDGIYRVPEEEAPMQGGLNIIPLSITGDTITVKLNGLSDDSNAGWEACLVTVDKDGNSSYSQLFTDGEEMSIPANGAESAYITIIGAPKKFVRENAFHKEKDSSYKNGDERRRYPYQFTMTGADIIRSGGYSKSKGKAHPNGGGFVASTAKVDASVYVGPDAMVLGNAVLTGNVRVEDHAVVANAVTASDNVIISGHAIVDGGGWIYVDNGWKQGAIKLSDNAVISDSAVVAGGVTVSGNAKVLQKAYLADGVNISGNAVAKGMAYAYGKGDYSGQVILDGDYANEENLKSGIGFGWLDTADPKYTDGTISGYGFDSECSTWSQDRHAATDALLCGNAQWNKERTSAKGVVSLDGIASYIELDNSVVKTDDIQISLGVLWKGGNKVQDVFFAGDEKAYMRFTPSNENGVAEFTITDGKNSQSLTADKALNKGEWSQVSIRIIDGKGELIINGKTTASEDITITPLNVLSASENDNVYIGKSDIASYFNGAADYCNFWFKPVDEPDMKYSGKEETDTSIMGDVDLNGKFELNDAVILQHWLLTGKDDKLKSWEMGNFIPDNSLDVFDLTVMKRELLKK